MTKLLLLRNLIFQNSRHLLTVLTLLILLASGGSSQAQVYFTTTNGDPNNAVAKDALNRMNYNGSDTVTIKSSISTSPSLLAIDPAHNRAFVYQALVATASIKVVDLTTGNITASLSTSPGVIAIKYNPFDDYIYYLTSDANYQTTADNDAVNRIKADGTNNAVLLKNISPTPVYMAADFRKNRVFVFQGLATARKILVVDLSTKSITSTIDLLPTDRFPSSGTLTALDYDGVSDYLYYLLRDGDPKTISATDALYKIHTDGTGVTIVKSSVTGSPADFKLDAGNNRGYIYEGLTANRAIKTIDLTNGNVTQVVSLSNYPSGNGSTLG
jgi:hypothetical protein